jgi:hypothetical protein
MIAKKLLACLAILLGDSEDKSEVDNFKNAATVSVAQNGMILKNNQDLPIYKHFAIFRKYIEHEDQLVYERLFWNVTIQGFLFAAYGFAIETYVGKELTTERLWLLYWFIILLPVLGSLSSVLSFFGVRAASDAISNLEKDWVCIERDWAKAHRLENSTKLPGITGGGDPKNIKPGFSGPRWIPICFIVVWLILLSISLYPTNRPSSGGATTNSMPIASPAVTPTATPKSVNHH